MPPDAASKLVAFGHLELISPKRYILDRTLNVYCLYTLESLLADTSSIRKTLL